MSPGFLFYCSRFIKFSQHFTLVRQRFFAVKFVLPFGDNQHRQRVAYHVQRGTRHIEDTVNAGR